MDIKLVNGTTLLAGELRDEAISIEDGYISQKNCIEVDLTGYYLLPGIIDLHGDAFEKHIAPRPSARFDTELALNAIDKDLAANGITTGWMALNWSWEGGRRSPEAAFRFAEALTNYNERSNTDIRIQIRCVTHTTDTYRKLIDFLKTYGVNYVVFNDHLKDALEYAETNIDQLNAWAINSGTNLDSHLKAISLANSQKHDVAEYLIRLSKFFDKENIRYGSHDDSDAITRKKFSFLGAKICEFPTSIEAAKMAKKLNEPVLMGAPNVVRGGSQSGNVAALELIEAGLCTALVSDYYYPSLKQSAFKLFDDGIISLADAWILISKNPAKIMGLDGLGELNIGNRADLVIVNKLNFEVEATICRGKIAFASGSVAERIFGKLSRTEIVSAA